MIDPNDFYTLKGYQQNSNHLITPCMEDYLEMIYRLLQQQSVVRIGELAGSLNVRPSSSTKVVQLLKAKGLINYQQYGYVTLTPQGQELAKYLYHRHSILHDFFCTVNHSENELELVEQTEHFMNPQTIANLEVLTKYLHNRHY